MEIFEDQSSYFFIQSEFTFLYYNEIAWQQVSFLGNVFCN